MVLDDCDVCMEYWVSNGCNMRGYRYLASNQHIPWAADHDHADTHSDIVPLCADTDFDFKCADKRPPPPPPPDTSMLSQPDQSHNITISEEDQTPSDQSSMHVGHVEATMRNDSTSMYDTLDDSEESAGLEPKEKAAASSAPGDKPQHYPVNRSSQETHKMRCLQLYKAATTGEWESAEKILREHEVLKTAKIRRDSETALHVAVGCGPRTIKFVEELLKLDWTRAELELTNMDGHTALGIAAKVGNLEAAILLVRKNPNLPNISSNKYPGFPKHCAAKYGHKELLQYLLDLEDTTNEAYINPDDHGKKFFKDIMKAEFYDVALWLIERDESLSKWGAFSGLNILAENPTSFSFGRDTKFLKWFVKKCYPDSIIQEDSNTTWKVKLWKLCEKLVPPLNHKVERLLKYRHAVKLVSLFCEGAERNFLDDGTSTTNRLVKEFKMPMQLAASNGIHEIIEEVTKKCPDAMWFYEHNNSDIFKLAIINRHPKVYNLLYELGDLYINTVRHSVDEEYEKGDNMLHLAASLAPPQRLNLISGAALQMQHEVQWYKEIENLVPLPFRNSQNHAFLTPRDVFLNSHQELMTEAKSWMKGTAKSCTISAALIATVVFAAAITVPGGNSGENGIPMFARNKAFTIFGVADALSLFTSCVSILMFLSILTSRYAEHDFLFALPKRLIIGLLALFVSITSMMVAFSATLYLVFRAHKLWILTSVGVSSFLPVAIFGYLQFSLISEMISSTYGSGMFRSRKTYGSGMFRSRKTSHLN